MPNSNLSMSLAVCAALTAVPAIADEIVIYGTGIDGLHQTDGQGFYDRVFSQIETDTAARLDVLPPKRTEMAFDACPTCCTSPANLNPEFYDYPSSFLVSDAMSEARVYIFTAPGTPALSSLSELAGLRVGTRQGMPYGTSIENAGLTLDDAPTIEANIQKLKAGRIDAFLAYTPDAYLAFEELGVDKFPHVEEAPVVVHPDALVCKPSPETEAYLAEFNASLADLIASGQLDALANE